MSAMMHTYSSIAIAGNSSISLNLATALSTRPGVRIMILASCNAKPVPAGTTLKLVDFDCATSLEESLKGVQVFISTLQEGHEKSEAKLMAAAKCVHVNLFIPSEACGDNAKKIGLDKHSQCGMKEIRLPELLLFAGVSHQDLCGLAWEIKAEKTVMVERQSKMTFVEADAGAMLVAQAFYAMPLMLREMTVVSPIGSMMSTSMFNLKSKL